MIEIQAENKSVKNKPYKRHHVWCDDELSSQDIEITKKKIIKFSTDASSTVTVCVKMQLIFIL